MLFCQNSKLILRHSKIFKTKKVFFLGNIQDYFPLYLSTINTKINLYKYNIYMSFKKRIKNIKNIHVYNNLLISQEMIKNCNTIIYYWPKNKSEAQFQLINLISTVLVETQIFIVGENSSGVKSASFILEKWVQLEKLESAKHSLLISGFVKNKIKFTLKDFFKTHTWKSFVIKSLPGVFGHKKIDEGSRLLASTFSKKITGKILDVGCGTGFLSASLLYISPKAIITLVDNNIIALTCSQCTLDLNKLHGKIVCSDLYSNVFEKFNLIISNPPFHEDLKTNFNIIREMIYGSKQYLTLNGELRFVVNSCFNYDFLLEKTFKKFSILKKTKKYKIYQCFLK